MHRSIALGGKNIKNQKNGRDRSIVRGMGTVAAVLLLWGVAGLPGVAAAY
ncbi:MAG: hypothetical protein WA882_15175 [Geitlerinemataceae cyanobacterium]